MRSNELFERIVDFLSACKDRVENYPYGGTIDLPPVRNMGHGIEWTDNKVLFSFFHKEVEIASDGDRVVAVVSDYDESDWERECPVSTEELELKDMLEAVRFISDVQDVPLALMVSWSRRFENA